MDGEIVSDAAVDVTTNALPNGWSESWGEPTRFLATQLADLRNDVEKLGANLAFIDRSARFSSFVGSSQLRNYPIHRWYYYKEGFSPRLPRLLVQDLGAGKSGTVVDPFAGIGTTALSLRQQPDVQRILGIEYSPFACFVAQTKLAAIGLNEHRLAAQVERLGRFSASRLSTVPSLAAFHNPEIFSPEILQDLLAARDHVREDRELTENEKAFFLLGLAAVVEDLSGAMKDGRALRILRGRKRRRQGLRPSVGAIEAGGAHAVITNQWLAMIEDLALLGTNGTEAASVQVRGDARALGEITDDKGQPLIPTCSVGLHLYSPPYLNFLDYTEVYKLELWLLEMVSDQASFRALREGTLRSHPSITFPERPELSAHDGLVFSVIQATTDFLVNNLSRPPIGRIHGYYFTDMYEALLEQYRTLEPGGGIACVVANSTLSRRVTQDSRRKEIWRVPIMTDIILARLAEAAGFVEIQIWGARNLQAKNVNGGYARESIVVGRKQLS